MHARVEHAEDGASLLLFDVEPFGGAYPTRTTLLTLAEGLLELRDACLELGDEIRWQPLLYERVLVDPRSFRQTAGARNESRAVHRRLRHPERGELRSMAEIVTGD